MKVFVLFLLSLLLGMMIYLKFEMDEARKVSNEIEVEYLTEEYTIKKVGESGYFGENEEGKSIYFKSEKVVTHSSLQIGNKVIVYFDKSGRIDGPVKIEKKE